MSRTNSKVINRPTCCNIGCDKLVHLINYSSTGTPKYRPYCGRCHMATYGKKTFKEGVTPIKKNYCENKDGRLNFICATNGSELRLRITTDSGSSWKTSGYVGTRWRFYYTNTSNNSDIENKTDVIWQWWYQQGGDTASQSRSFGEVYLSNPSLGSYPHAFGEYSGAEGNQIIVGSMSGKYQSGGAYNGLQLTKSNGANFYAKVILYGIK